MGPSSAGTEGPSPKKATKKREAPNIVIIYADDLDWKDTGYIAYRYYETPNIDKLGTERVVFTNAYTGAANCAPSRACLMTGQNTPRHGIYTVGNSDRGKKETRKLIPIPNTEILRDEFITLAEAARQSGYATCHIGKWHLGKDACPAR